MPCRYLLLIQCSVFLLWQQWETATWIHSLTLGKWLKFKCHDKYFSFYNRVFVYCIDWFVFLYLFNRHHFTNPPPTALDSPSTSQGPFLFPSYYLNPPQVRASSLTFPAAPPRPTTLYFRTRTPPRAPSTSFTGSFTADTTWHGPDTLPFTSSSNTPLTSQDSASPILSGEASSCSKSRGKNWSDAETRFLLEIWRDSYPISKRRNSGSWDSIATKLNKNLVEQGITMFLSGTRCKARIKHLEDEYKQIKDHNNRSGNNRETFEYYEDLDVVLGCKPNITPKFVLDCGLDTSDELKSDSCKN